MKPTNYLSCLRNSSGSKNFDFWEQNKKIFTHREHDAELMASRIWDDFAENDDVKALKIDRGISHELAMVCQYHVAKARLEHDEKKEARFTQEALGYFQRVIGKKETWEFVCRLDQYAAFRFLDKKNSSIGCFTGENNKKALKYMKKCELGWKKMTRLNKNTLSHVRYFSHQFYSITSNIE